MKHFFKIISLSLLIFLFTCQKKPSITTQSQEALQYYKNAEELRFKLYYTDALSLYQKAFKIDSCFALAPLRIAQFYMNLGLEDSSNYYINKARAISVKVSDYERLLINRNWAILKGDDKLTNSIMDTLKRKYPNDLEVKVMLANQKWQRLDHDGARLIFQNILKQNPNYLLAYNNIGYLYAQKGFFKEAIKYLEDYKKLAPNQLNPYDSLAEIYLCVGRYYEAIKLLEAAFNSKSEEIAKEDFIGTIIHLHLAEAYKNLGQYNKALSITEEALNNYSTDYAIQSISRFRFINIFKELNLINEMEMEFICIQGKDDILDLLLRGLLNIQKMDFRNALETLSALQKKTDEVKDNYSKRRLFILSAYLEGELNFKTGLYNEAAKQFKLAAETYSDTTGSVHLRLMQHLSEGKAGNYNAAITGLNKILMMNPNYAPALLYISKFYLESGKRTEAKSYIQHFINLWENADPDTPFMREAILIQKRLS